jgi:PAS domain S-box-containing protein
MTLIKSENSYDWELYTQLISFMNEAVWVWDENERTVHANPKFCEIMEYSLEEMLGRESYEFWDTESAKTVRKTNGNERKSWKASSYEWNLLSKSGKLVPVLLSGAPLPNGWTVGIMTDLRDLRKREKSERILSQAVEQAGDGIMLINSESMILSWNRWARKIFGYKSEEVEWKNVIFLFPALSGDIMRNIYSEKVEWVETTIESKTDGSRHVTVSITPVHEKNSVHEPLFLCIVHDITLQKKADAELTVRYQKIKNAYEWLWKVQRENDYITDLIDTVSNGYESKKIFPAMIHALIIISKADACEIRSFHHDTWDLHLDAHYGFEWDIRTHKVIPFSGSWTEQSCTEKIPYNVMDLATEKKTAVIQHLLSEHFSSSLTTALYNREWCIGSITFFMKMGNTLDLFENEFLERYIKLVEIVMNTRDL